MKAKTLMFIVILIFVLIMPKVFAMDKLSLLIVAHGSPLPQWNNSVLNLENEVKQIMAERQNDYSIEIRVAFMEFCEPSINTVIMDMEDKGVDRIYVLPLLIAPSGHSQYDIPTILGLYNDKNIVETIRKEGTVIVDTRIKITIGPTLHWGDILKEIMLDRVKELSTTPDSEGVVLLAHGDSNFHPIWASLCNDIGYYISANTGICHYDYAFVEIGQSFLTEGAPVIFRINQKCSKTIVVGLYLSTIVKSMVKNSSLKFGMMNMLGEDIIANKNILFAEHGLLPDKRISEWVVDRVMEWVNFIK